MERLNGDFSVDPLAVSALVAAVSVASSLLPALHRSTHPVAIQLLHAMASGALVSLGVVHALPHSAACVTRTAAPYRPAHALALITFAVLLLIESNAESLRSLFAGRSCEPTDVAATDGEKLYLLYDRCCRKKQQGGYCIQLTRISSETTLTCEDPKCPNKKIAPSTPHHHVHELMFIVLAGALSFHAATDGILFRVAFTSYSRVAAMVLLRGVEALSLGACFAASNPVSLRSFSTAVLLYSCSFPAAVMYGGALLPHESHRALVVLVLSASIAGVLLYVGATRAVVAGFFSHSAKSDWRSIGCFVFGAVLIWLATVFLY